MRSSYFIHKIYRMRTKMWKGLEGFASPRAKQDRGQDPRVGPHGSYSCCRNVVCILISSSVLCKRDTRPDGYIDLQPVFAVVPFHGRREVLDTFVHPIEPAELLVIA